MFSFIVYVLGVTLSSVLWYNVGKNKAKEIGVKAAQDVMGEHYTFKKDSWKNNALAITNGAAISWQGLMTDKTIVTSTNRKQEYYSRWWDQRIESVIIVYEKGKS